MQNIDENKNTLPYRDTRKKLERNNMKKKIKNGVWKKKKKRNGYRMSYFRYFDDNKYKKFRAK